jgi:signal transduction histidine kinase/ABC-type uncharacterized transport system substrate-binding protein
MEHIRYIIIFSLYFFASQVSLFAETSYSGKKILILNSYHANYSWSEEFIGGALGRLEGKIGKENIYIEHLDGRRFADDSLYFLKISELLSFKYQNASPDVIISADDFAFEFISTPNSKLFSSVPIVFAGLNSLPADKMQTGNYTGVLEGLDTEGNLRIIFRLLPKTQRIILAGGGTAADNTILAKATEQMQQYLVREDRNNIETEIWTNLTEHEMLQKATELSLTDAVLFASMQRYSDNKYFSYTAEIAKITEISKAPVFGMYGGMGSGLVAGRFSKPAQQGADAAKIALSILTGQKPEDIAVIDKPGYENIFDYGQLKKHGIPIRLIPKGSKLIGQPSSFIEENKKILVIYTLVVLLLLAIIVLLYITVHKKQKAEKMLKTFNASLETKIAERTSELEKHKEILKQSNSDKLTFFSILAHDLRSPFNSIMGFSHILGIDNSELTLDEAKEYGRSIYDSSQSMFRLLENLLDWSRVMNKTKTASPVHFPLSTILSQNINLLKPGADAKKISVEAEGDVSAIVNADYNMVNSVVQNLLSNAIKFTPENGKISINVFSFPDNDFVDIVVEDNGLGIPENARRNLFKLDRSRTTAGTNNEKGSGLGLLLCKEFVEMNGGEIWVASEEGKGTSITVRLLKNIRNTKRNT